MDAKTLERIFEPFFTTKPAGKGTGWAWPWCMALSNRIKAHIAVDSQVGVGTTFRLYFPGEANAAAALTAPESQVPSGCGQRILLLDDEPALTSALQRLLVRLNYQVATSNSPRETSAGASKIPRGLIW